MLGAVFVKRGLVPDTGSSVTLPRRVSAGVMAEMCLTGRIYDAAWAERRGIVNEVVPADELLDTPRRLAREIAANPPLCATSSGCCTSRLPISPR